MSQILNRLKPYNINDPKIIYSFIDKLFELEKIDRDNNPNAKHRGRQNIWYADNLYLLTIKN